MAAKIDFFRVSNGDMTLVRLESGYTLLVDCRIRKADDDTPDVAKQLKDLLKRDGEARPYVDAMLLSHPDEDHCLGLKTDFHLGAPETYPKSSDMILIREMWSSPIVFRRASADHNLCPDADGWCTEARRRVRRFRALGYSPAGERVKILGKDIDGKTDGLGPILVEVGESWSTIDQNPGLFEALLLAPVHADTPGEEEVLSKNDSSTVIRFKIASGHARDACRFLTGGDAGVAIWERIWDRNKDQAKERLGYDLLLSPHHCSWHSLSLDSWSQYGEDAKVSEKARKALGQPRAGATIIASSKTICDDDSDPPCIRAEREYKDILKSEAGKFICVGDDGPNPLAFDIESGGLKRRMAKAAAALTSTAFIGAKPVSHG